MKKSYKKNERTKYVKKLTRFAIHTDSVVSCVQFSCLYLNKRNKNSSRNFAFSCTSLGEWKCYFIMYIV